MWDILYRPRKYSDVLGQECSVRLLKTRINKGTAFDTSYIFAGGYGRGKTTLSRIHAMAMLCQDLNKADPEPCGQCDNCTEILNEQSQAFTERDAASSGSTDNMRALVEELPYVLENAPKRIYLIDECQRMHHAAQDVLLKPIEEKKMVAMLCTTEAEKIRGAIRSRCEEYTIKRVTRDDVLPRMKMVLNEQGVPHEDDAVWIIIDRAEGHVRNVLNNLEMVAQLGPITVESVREYLNLSVVTLYYQILLNLDDPLRAIELVGRACESTPADEVAAGLAEAAMNCYRMAHGWFADFAYVDKSLAEQVYNKYQDHVVRYAKWFLVNRNVTRLSLELDILAFSQNSGNLPPELVAPPVVMASQVAVQPAALPTAPTATATAPVPAALAATAPSATGAVRKETRRESARPGPDGSADRTPNTPVESTAFNQELPRGALRADTGVTEPPGKSRNSEVMGPEEWLAHFDRFCKKRSVTS